MKAFSRRPSVRLLRRHEGVCCNVDRSPGRSGFALVIALSLMAFILLLVLYMSTLLRVESQAAETNQARLLARQNATLAMMKAVGELQKAAGPDGRVTARADLSGSGVAPEKALWTGVWDSTTGSLLDFLVSGEGELATALGEDPAVMASYAPAPGDPPDYEVRVEKESIPESGGSRFAYWVAGEGTKATVRGVPGAGDSGDLAPLTTSLAPGMAGFEFVLGDGPDSAYTKLFGEEEHLDEGSEAFSRVSRVEGIEALSLLAPGVEDAAGLYFNDLTTLSLGLPVSTHPDVPGLKHDLSQRPDTSQLGSEWSLGPGYEAYADFQDYMVDPESESFGGIVGEAGHLRRIYRMQPPTPAVGDLKDGTSYPDESPEKGSIVFSAHPVLTQFHLRFFPYPLDASESEPETRRAVNRDAPVSDRDIGLRFTPMARFWNPYTSALEMSDYVMQVEVRGFPEVDMRFRDIAHAGNETVTSFDAHAVFGDPMVFEYQLKNHRRTAPNSEPENTRITPNEAYDERVLGPGRVMPFVRSKWLDFRRPSPGVFRHSSNHMSPSFHGGGSFNSDPVLVRLSGTFPSGMDESEGEVPPLDSGQATTTDRNYDTTQTQQAILDNVRAIYEAPPANLNIRVYVKEILARDSDGNVTFTGPGTLVQEIDAEFPGLSGNRLRKYEETAISGANVNALRDFGITLGRSGGGWYVLGAEEVELSYSVKMRESTLGPGGYPEPDQWLEHDVRAIYAREGTGPRDIYGENYANMDVWSSNFDSIFGWTLSDIQGRSGNTFESLLVRREQISTWMPELHSRTTRRDLYLFELPRRPQLSLGALQHLQVHGYPPYAIGNSRGRDANAATGGDGLTSDIREDLNLIFDRYFLSGIVPGVSETGFGDPAAPDLPHPNRVFHNPAPDVFGQSPGDLLSAAGRDSAAFLMTEGAFNVNSTSDAAWRALLGSNRLFDFEYAEADRNLWDADHTGPDDVATVQDSDALFTRFPMSLQEIDPTVMPESGDPDFSENLADYKQSRTRVASDAGGGDYDITPLRQLSAAIVDLIQDRGAPFRTLAEFLGPLDPNDPESGSLLEQAIAEAGLNDPSVHRRSPGFLTQADILNNLAPVLQTRSDTFRVRGYGEVENPLTGDRVQAWCEAVVQRVADPVEKPASMTPADYLAALRTPPGPFGRKFEIVSFRWLDPSEVSR